MSQKDTIPGWLAAVIILGGIAGIFITTKPSDEVCQAKAIRHSTGTILGMFAESFDVPQYVYTVEDHIFWKSIRNNITGAEVGYAYLGGVHMQ